MGDLISRQAVFDIIQGELALCCGYDADIALFSVKKCVSELPTAYDVEGVVAELNKAESVKTFGSSNSGNRLIPVKDAINIVKKSGIPAAEQEEGE